jgi:hypothetical protein
MKLEVMLGQLDVRHQVPHPLRILLQRSWSRSLNAFPVRQDHPEV